MEAVGPAAVPPSLPSAQPSVPTQAHTTSTSATPVRQPSGSNHCGADIARSHPAYQHQADPGARHGSQLAVAGQNAQPSAQLQPGTAAEESGLARGGITGGSNGTMHQDIAKDNAARLADMDAAEVRHTLRFARSLEVPAKRAPKYHRIP